LAHGVRPRQIKPAHDDAAGGIARCWSHALSRLGVKHMTTTAKRPKPDRSHIEPVTTREELIYGLVAVFYVFPWLPEAAATETRIGVARPPSFGPSDSLNV